MKKFFIILLCIVTGLIGLFMSGCGGISLVVFPNAALIALPFLLVGVVGLWAAKKGFAAVRRNATEDAAQGISIALCVMLTVIGLFAVGTVGLLLFGRALSQPVSNVVFMRWVLVPGLVVLVAGLAGTGYAVHARRRRVDTIGEMPGTTPDNADPASPPRDEMP